MILPTGAGRAYRHSSHLFVTLIVSVCLICLGLPLASVGAQGAENPPTFGTLPAFQPITTANAASLTTLAVVRDIGENPVANMVWTSDGSLLATAGDWIWRYDPQDIGASPRVFATTASVSAVTSDGALLATKGDAMAPVEFWDVATGTSLGMLFVPEQADPSLTWTEPVGFSPDDTLLVTYNRGGIARLWNVASRTQTAALDPRGFAAGMTPSFSPDGSRLVTTHGFQDGRLWDTASGVQLAELGCSGHAAAPFSPDSTMVAVGGFGGFGCPITVWDTQAAKLLTTLDVAGPMVFNPDGTLLLTGDQYLDSQVLLWDVNDWTQVGALESRGGVLRALTFSPDGTLLAVATESQLALWDTATWTRLARLEMRCIGIAFNPGGTLLAVIPGGTVMGVDSNVAMALVGVPQ